MPLVNVPKKLEKARSKLGLAPDEQILGGCTANPRNTVGAAAAGGIVGAAINAAASKKTHELSAEGLLAERYPKGRGFLGLTERRLFLTRLSALSGAPKEIAAEWTRGEVASITLESGKVADPLTITFSDGSAVQVEAAKGSGAKEFAEAADRFLGR